MERVELHAHTKMSAMDGLLSPTDLVRYAAQWGHKAVAITDHGAVQAFPEACQAGKTYGIKVIYGAEVELANQVNPIGHVNHATLLVKNATGLKNLYKLLTISHTDYFFKRPILPKYILTAHREGLLVGSSCDIGELQEAIICPDADERLTEIVEYYDFLEIQPHKSGRYDWMKKPPHDVEAVNRKIIELGEKLGKPVVATGDVHFLDRDDINIRSALHHGLGYDKSYVQPPLHFMTTEEMLAALAYLGKEKAFEVVVTNTNCIADIVEEISPIPEGLFLPQLDNAEVELVRCCHFRLEILNTCNRHVAASGNREPSDAAKSRLDTELDSIVKNGYAAAYMIARSLVMKALGDERCVSNRGSIGSSFVAYLLGITDVDPLEYDIPFEVFAGLDGSKPPDISLLFDGEYQAAMHEYIKEVCGADRVYKGGTILTMAEKTARGYAKGFLGEHGDLPPGYGMDRFIASLTGVKRSSGSHPGRFYILPEDKDIYDFTPVQYAGNGASSGALCTHFDYRALNDTLLHVDLLGHDSLTMLAHLRALTGVSIDDMIAKVDSSTLDLLIYTDALGVPEYGTPFVREIIELSNPQSFSEFVKIIGLSHGENVWLDNADTLMDSGTMKLAELIALRDDIMVNLMGMGIGRETSYEIMESVGKGHGLTDEQVRLMALHGVPDWYMQSCQTIRYLMPKAQAVEYAMIAFRVAWFKTHHPLAFYSVYFEIVARHASNYITDGLDALYVKLEELYQKKQHDGLSKMEADIMAEMYVYAEFHRHGFTMAKAHVSTSDATAYIIGDGSLTPPLTSIPHIGESDATGIVEERALAPFLSVDDCITRLQARGVSQPVCDELYEYGAMTGLT